MSKKTLIGTLAGAVAMGGMIIASAQPAEAQWRRGGWGGHGGYGGAHYGRGYHGGYYGRRNNAGGAIAAGIIGGLALGALAASAQPSYAYGGGYGYAPGYYAPPPPPRYYARPTYYRQAYSGWAEDDWGECRIVRRRVVDGWGYVRVRRVRVCY